MTDTAQTRRKTAAGRGWDPKRNSLVRLLKDCGVDALRIKLLILAVTHTHGFDRHFFTKTDTPRAGGVQPTDPKCMSERCFLEVLLLNTLAADFSRRAPDRARTHPVAPPQIFPALTC